jgi:homoserine dehydrogenase
VNLLLVGFGVVGRALAVLLEEQGAALYAAHGCSPRVTGVIDSGGAAWDAAGLDARALLAVKEQHGTVAALPARGVTGVDAAELIAASDAHVVVEATPTTVSQPAPAIARLKAAFRSGKHVVCVNKGPLAVAFPALLELARHNRVAFRYSGTVGAGTPMLAFAAECARGTRVTGVRAVLNGTTNFILWRMAEAGEDYATALAEAMRLGYAEADPSADVDGIDAATKLVILANGVLGRPCALADLAITGIRGVTPDDIARARGAGHVVKLIAALDEGLRVAPAEVPADSPLNVPASLNALSLSLATGGEVTLVGRGAGGRETATAIVRDLIDIWHAVAHPAPAGTEALA